MDQNMKTCFAIRTIMNFLILFISLNSILFAQYNNGPIKITTTSGLVEISASSQEDPNRLLSVKLDGHVIKRFKTPSGNLLDLLAMYKGFDSTYLVIRTNMGVGGCVGTDVYVIRIHEKDEKRKGTQLDVSPILQKCMGEIPVVKFEVDKHGNTVVIVAEFALRDNRWAQSKYNK